MTQPFVERRGILHLAVMVAILATVGIIDAYWHPAYAQLNMNSGLLVNTRDRFRICIETSPPLEKLIPAIHSKLAHSLQVVRQHRDWESAGFGQEVPRLETRCGAKMPASLLEPGNPTAVGRGRTNAPSPYRTVVIVLDRARAEKVLGERQAALVPFEVMCTTNECAEVTSALVVGEDFLESPQFLDPYFTLAVGLEPTRKLVPPRQQQVSK